LQNAVPIVANDGREDHTVARHTDNHSPRLQLRRRAGGFGRRFVAVMLAVSALVPAYAALPDLTFASGSSLPQARRICGTLPQASGTEV